MLNINKKYRDYVLQLTFPKNLNVIISKASKYSYDNKLL